MRRVVLVAVLVGAVVAGCYVYVHRDTWDRPQVGRIENKDEVGSLMPSWAAWLSDADEGRPQALLLREGDSMFGSGGTQFPYRVSADGDTLCVRSERAGSDPAGRHYTLSVVATDDCGNVSPPAVIGTIHVPHDGGGQGCIRP